MNRNGFLARTIPLLSLLFLTKPAAAQRAPEELKEQTADRAWPKPEKKKGAEVDFAILPIGGGNTDYGIAVGAMGSVAWIDPEKPPYTSRIEGTAITSFRSRDGFEIPYQDYYLKGVHRQFPFPSSRFTWRAGFLRASTLQYSGIGNNSLYDRTWERLEPETPEYAHAQKQYDFDRMSPGGAIEIRTDLPLHLYYETSVSFTHNSVSIADDSALAKDRRSPNAFVRSEVDGPLSHGIVLFTQAFGYDTRDSEIATTSGQFHRASVRVSPGGTGYLAHGYSALNLTLRAYLPLFEQRVVIAGRLVGDVLFGDPPFYELARYETGWAVGGSSGVRGVPAQRYYGRAKVFGNIEARIHLFRFGLLGQKMKFGVATFFDAGRVWADLESRPELDGKGLGIKYGTGGGIRLGAGKSFEARADIAYSPDANPIGAYVSAGQAF